MKQFTFGAIGAAVLSAFLYALSTPFSKLLLAQVSAGMLASLLYLGAGMGMGIWYAAQKCTKGANAEHHLQRSDLGYVLLMIVLDIAAPLLFFYGLKASGAASAALLNNFELVATALIALVLFHEPIGKRLWFGILLITCASILLSLDGLESGVGLSFSVSSLLIPAACICWGLENNCTRKLSSRNPVEIVMVKGLFSGLGAGIVALFMGETLPALLPTVLTLLLGFCAYGLSIRFYVYAQRTLGAAKTGVYSAIAPFFSAILCVILFDDPCSIQFFAAFLLMLAGVCLTTLSTKLPMEK